MPRIWSINDTYEFTLILSLQHKRMYLMKIQNMEKEKEKNNDYEPWRGLSRVV